ncbi:hypothetical protein L596_011268 [Steinernema carpocapsae]|uniref:Uncharacterized protein n=1 Tax=Steinernema carpocapsae TaxID=34508 RepID=A0A4U5NUB4_STECR|nr:hypothetical protein L596_011268 [Steinernema carpocapsae]
MLLQLFNIGKPEYRLKVQGRLGSLQLIFEWNKSKTALPVQTHVLRKQVRDVLTHKICFHMVRVPLTLTTVSPY